MLPSQILEGKVKVTQFVSDSSGPVDYTVHALPQARILEQVAISFSRESSQIRA